MWIEPKKSLAGLAPFRVLPLLLLLMSGCGGGGGGADDLGQPEGGSCSQTSDCRYGLTCEFWICVRPGSTDGDRFDNETTSDREAEGEAEAAVEMEMDTVTDERGWTWVALPGGSFWMGASPSDDRADPNEKPRHEVEVPPFEIMQTEVTEAQFLAVMEYNPSLFEGCLDCPVESVTRSSAQMFCEAIGAHLPTEAQWEYAARSGSPARYGCGDNLKCLVDIAWYATNSAQLVHPVMGKTPNAFALYDMLGNVAEWVQDCAHPNYTGAPDAANAPWTEGCSSWEFITRGGSWQDFGADALRVSSRTISDVWAAPSTGFRCARGDLAPPTDGDTDDVNPFELAWITLEGGTFDMGCAQSILYNDEERPVHTVEAPEFQINETEVTNNHYAAFLNSHGNSCSGRSCYSYWSTEIVMDDYTGQWGVRKGYETYPAGYVSWLGAREFCQWLGGRLPSESEWEYAARAGTTTLYPCGTEASCLDDFAWHADNCSAPHPVRQKSPNAFGLYDMMGNEDEWVEDGWHETYVGAPEDGSAWEGPMMEYHVVRGGNYDDAPGNLRTSIRSYGSASQTYYGFRCARNVR